MNSLSTSLWTSLFFVFSFYMLPSCDADRFDSCPSVVRISRNFKDTYEYKCYLFIDDEMYWTEAREYCRRLDGRLVEITDDGIMRFLRGRLSSAKLGWRKNGVWIGASDMDEDQTWHWTNGNELTYTNWASGEPSKSWLGVSLENCAVMWRASDWQWHDKACSASLFHYYFICQFDMEMRQQIRINEPVTVHSGINETILEDMEHKHGDKAYSNHSGLDHDEGMSKDTIVALAMGLVALLAAIVAAAVIYIYCKRRYKRPPPYVDEPPLFENMTCEQMVQYNAYPLRPPSYSPPEDGRNIYIPTQAVVETMDQQTDERTDDRRSREKTAQNGVLNVYENNAGVVDDAELADGARGGVDTDERVTSVISSKKDREDDEKCSEISQNDDDRDGESHTLLDNERNERLVVNNVYQPDILFHAQRSVSDDGEHLYEDIHELNTV